MNSLSGQLPMHQAMKLITANSVLPERGGTLMMRRLLFPMTTRSRAWQIASWCQFSLSGMPFRASNSVLVNVSRSVRHSAICSGLIVLSSKCSQDSLVQSARRHRSIGRGVLVLLHLGPAHLGFTPPDHGRGVAAHCFLK